MEMDRVLLKSKIHRATVTEANLDYEGSITIDKDLMDAAELVPYEQVHIFNMTNGAAAHLAREGDTVIIASFASYNENEVKRHESKLVYLNGKNKIKKIKPEPNKLTLAYSVKPLI